MKPPVAELDLLASLKHIGAQAPQLAELFDYLEDVMLWMKDVKGRYTWANIAFLINFNIKHRAQVLGRTDFDFSGAARAHQYILDDQRVLKGERILARVELIGRFDHNARWCVTSKVPLHGPKGQIVGTAGIAHPLCGASPLTGAEAPLSQAMRYISERYGETITNLALAKACGLSVRAFERQFRATYNVSPHDYVRQLRVRLSCSALVFSRKSLCDVASAFGFHDQSHYTKEFRRVLGETPHAYRVRFRHDSPPHLNHKLPPIY